MDKNRLEELVKSALMGPMNEKKQRPDYPDIDGDGDTEEPMVKAAKDKEKAEANESLSEGNFDELKKHQKMQRDAGDFFRSKAKELNVDVDKIVDFNKGVNGLVDAVFKADYDRTGGKIDESFDSLVKKVDKAKGYTKKEAEKVAGAIAAKKRAGAGKGPTAKQKKRMAETILKELRG